MTERVQLGPKRRGRPRGSKNKKDLPAPQPTAVQAHKALVDCEREFIVGMYNFLGAPVDNWPKPQNNMDSLVQSIVSRAMDKEDKTAHQFAKLIMERVIPQRKQVEHLGDSDARNMGVNINIVTESAKHGHERKPIEHEPVGREQSVRAADIGGRDEKQPHTVVIDAKAGSS